jgi:acetate kinase
VNILTLNAGSTSIKFALFQENSTSALRHGEISWADGNRHAARLVFSISGNPQPTITVNVPDGRSAAECAIRTAVGEARNSIDVIGHRVVHGGTQLRDSTLITDGVKETIASLGDLAPLHNPPALQAILAAEKLFPNLPQVAVFDTAFYKDLPPENFLYPLPYEYYERWGIRRFGFHGISYDYCSRRAADMLGRDLRELNLILCHLGGGCSATAVRQSKPIATTLGFSPLDGLMMGTRCGSLDPGILLALQTQQQVLLEKLDHDLNYASGLLGISGISADLAGIEAAAAAGNPRAKLAFAMFADRVRSAIGAFAVTLGAVDAIVFTDRIGEHSPGLRETVCDGLQIIGISLDHTLNNGAKPDIDVATPNSRSRVLVIHTREELMIAREALRVARLK